MLKLDDLRTKVEFNNSLIAPALARAGFKDLAGKVKICSQWSAFATCQSCGARYFVGTSGHCDSRFCSVCSKRRALAWLAKMVPLLEDYRRRGYLVFFLNLTIKDGESLDESLALLARAWRYMTHDDRQSRKEFRALNNGGVRSVEIKIGAGSGAWHPHMHSIVIVKSDTEVRQFEDYRALWERATRNAFGAPGKYGSVYIHGITDKGGKRGDTGLMRGVVETFKYMCKFDWVDLPPERLRELVTVTAGRHFISSWGELYGLNKQVQALMDESTERDLTKEVCKVCGCTEFDLDNLLTVDAKAPVLYFDQ